MNPPMDQKVTWSDLELSGLLEEEDAHVYYEKTTKHLALHPYHLNNVRQGVNQILRSSLNIYDREFQGFTLAFRNPKLLSHLGELFYDSPFVHIDIEADFYIFRPTVGSFLKGIVNKKGLDHIVILVHKIYTISIPKPDNIDEEWPGDSVEIGQEVRCCVTEINNRSKLPFICATLKSDYLQGCRLLQNINEVSNTDDNTESQNINTGTVANSASEDISEKKKIRHLKKYKRSNKINTELISESGTQSDSSNNVGNDTYKNVKHENSIANKNGVNKSHNLNSTIKIGSLSSTILEDDDKEKIKRRKKLKRSQETDIESVYEDGTQTGSSNNAENKIYKNIKHESDIDNKSSVHKSHNLGSIIKIESLNNNITKDYADKEKIKHQKKRKRSQEIDTEFTQAGSSNNAENGNYKRIKRENDIDNNSSVHKSHNLNCSIKIESLTNSTVKYDADKVKIKHQKKRKRSQGTDTESAFTDEVKTGWNNNAENNINRNIKCESDIDSTNNTFENRDLNSIIKKENSTNYISGSDIILDKEKIKRKKHKKSHNESVTDESEATSSFNYSKVSKKSKKSHTLPNSESTSPIKIKTERSDSDLRLEYPVKIKVEHV